MIESWLGPQRFFSQVGDRERVEENFARMKRDRNSGMNYLTCNDETG
jgi:hypothetical protein